MGLGSAGCAAQQADSLRLSEELGRARSDAAWQETRAAEFEARVSRLEQRLAATQSIQRAEQRELMNRLERLIALNERLTPERTAEQAPATRSAKAPRGASAPSREASTVAGESVSSDERELRALVERLRGNPGSPHGGLTREQENALRVLIRPERKLDTENPWPATFY